MAYLLARNSSHLDFHHPERGLQFDHESVASFVKRELSQNVLNYVAGPLISTLFFYGSEETSAWLYLVLAKHMYNVRMSTLRGGVGRLASALSRGVSIVPERPVMSLAAEGGSYVIDAARFSDVVIAIPGNQVLEISGIESLISGEDREFFRDCRYQRVVSVQVASERPLDGGCYAVSIPRVEKLSAATISFHDYIDPSSVPAGQGLLMVTGGGPSVDSSRLLEDLKMLYRFEPLTIESSEWVSGMPKFPPGRFQQIAEFNRRPRHRGLHFCGDYLLGPFIEGAITTGFRVAETIARYV